MHCAGIPVFFVDSPLEQLWIGQMVCFVTFGIYMWFRPYRDVTDNHLQMVCQMGIFFALMSKTMLDHPDVTDRQVNMTGTLLLAASAAPAVTVIYQECTRVCSYTYSVLVLLGD